MLPYIRLEYDESVDAKKAILSTQISILKIAKKIEFYKKLRKQELIQKSALKKELRLNLSKVNSILYSLPESEPGRIKLKSEKAKEKPVETKNSRNIESQLIEIKEKLSKL